MVSADFTDPYIDPETGILRNKVGARSQRDLDAAEADFTAARAYQLIFTNPIKPTGDLDELRAIHRHLFQDIYQWAGRLRTVDISKNLGPDEATEFFLPHSMLVRGMGFAAEELRADNYLRGMERDQFIKRLAHHYDQWNYGHPFREGNGRATRLFWDRISQDAGFQLDWQRITGTINNQASRVAMENRDFSGLQEMFVRITTPMPATGATDDAQRLTQLRRLSFPLPARESIRNRPNQSVRPPRRGPQAHGRNPGQGVGEE